MKRFRSPRLLLVSACLAAAVTGALVAAERSSSAMADAATAFLSSLTPEQRQKATFAFDSAAVPLELHPDRGFPRNGLMTKDMSDAQRQRPTPC
jgi:hypothetical protein